MDLISEVLSGSRLALSRLLTQIENDTPAGRAALDALFPSTGAAYLIGVTGAPGTGKSSLVNQLALHYRRSAEGAPPPKIAIVAVDPSSPFTGGAILGDRIRMRELSGDTGVFIRSMASRGALGGIAQATAGLVQAFDAAGYEIIIIETVGAGQAEVDIARLAHTTIVVEAPGLGDDIQAIKAGILEIADLLVVNKADRAGVESTERALRNMLQLAHPVRRSFDTSSRHHTAEPDQDELVREAEEIWIPPIIRTIATEGEGIQELADQINAHKDFLQRTGERERRDRIRLENELANLLRVSLVERWRNTRANSRYTALLEEVLERKISPRRAVHTLLESEAET